MSASTDAPAQFPADPAPAAPAPELTVIVPCYNECANVAPMVARLATTLHGIAWEVLFVDDDSPDGTAAAARRLGDHDPRVRCIRRIGRRGLSSAVIEGALAAAGTFVAVIDGDLQHDETRLPEMLARLRADVADVAIGSRRVEGGDDAGLADGKRRAMSDLGGRLAQAVLPQRVSDPMSGFFMLRRELFEQTAPRLTGQGFKILVDVLLSARRTLRVTEVPYRFQPRNAGESKLDVLVLAQFGGLLLDKMCHGLLPLRFVSFALVGMVGLLAHLAVLSLGRRVGLEFELSQIAATLVAMVVNFELNNRLTYRSVRLRGAALWRGRVLFLVVCGLGAVANIGIAHTLYLDHSGWTPAGAVGAAVGLVWNYAISATLVWRTR